MKYLTLILAVGSLLFWALLMGCDLSKDDRDTIVSPPPTEPWTSMSVSMIESNCSAGTYLYSMSAHVFGLPQGVTVVSVRYTATDGWTETLDGNTSARHTFRSCGPSGSPGDGWQVCATGLLSNGREAISDCEPVAPCSWCE